MISYPGFGENISDKLKKKLSQAIKKPETLYMSDNVLEKRVLSLKEQRLLDSRTCSEDTVYLAVLKWFQLQITSDHFGVHVSFSQDVVWLLCKRLVEIPNDYHGGKCLESQGI